jgi:hypothetical protein
VENFAPDHLAYDSGYTEKVGVATIDRVPRDYLGLPTSAYILPGSGVIGKRAEGNELTISALLIISRALNGPYASDNNNFIECFQVAAPG